MANFRSHNNRTHNNRTQASPNKKQTGPNLRQWAGKEVTVRNEKGKWFYHWNNISLLPNAATVQQSRDQKYCHKHGWNQHGSDDCGAFTQAEREWKPSFNSPSRPAGNGTSCSICGKTNHEAANCRSKQNKNIFDTEMPDASMWTQPAPEIASLRSNDLPKVVLAQAAQYCLYCNNFEHATAQCRNATGRHNHHYGIYLCFLCGSHGHLANECKNPVKNYCKNCYEPSHGKNKCPHNAKTDSLVTVRENLMHTEWLHKENRSRNLFQGPHALARRQQWIAHFEERRLQGDHITKEEMDRAEADICMTYCAADLASHQDVQTQHPHVASRALARYPSMRRISTTRQPKRQPTSQASKLPSYEAELAHLEIQFEKETSEVVEAMRRQGHGESAISILVETATKLHEEKIFNITSRYEDHFKKSMCYIDGCVNFEILAKERTMLNNPKCPVTQRKFWDMKRDMATHVKLYRNTGAMKALFDRQMPVCRCCKREGLILDERWDPVDSSLPIEEYFKLKDYSDWGLFVAMPCSCSLSGYTFSAIPDHRLQMALQQKARQLQHQHAIMQ